ncbi:MAG: hypothetical protein ABIR58_07740 [Gemmatimonadaceae bacterium]
MSRCGNGFSYYGMRALLFYAIFVVTSFAAGALLFTLVPRINRLTAGFDV